MKKIFLLILLGFILTQEIFAQCCSPGSPVAGSANIGILSKNKFRLISFYRQSYSENYYEGFRRSDYAFLKNAGFQFSGVILGYGITEKFTIEAEAGYFFKKFQTFNLSTPMQLSGSGFSSGVVSGKVNLLLDEEREWEITSGLGLKFPFIRRMISEDNVVLPQDLQPSTGAFGLVGQLFVSKGFTDKGWRIIMLNRTEINQANDFDYRYGNTSMTSFFVTRKITRSFTGILQARHELKLKDTRGESAIDYSGGNQVFIAPQLNYAMNSGWNISALIDTPVFQYLNGRQIGNKYAFSVMVIRDF